jgi:hypothetical protein
MALAARHLLAAVRLAVDEVANFGRERAIFCGRGIEEDERSRIHASRYRKIASQSFSGDCPAIPDDLSPLQLDTKHHSMMSGKAFLLLNPGGRWRWAAPAFGGAHAGAGKPEGRH